MPKSVFMAGAAKQEITPVKGTIIGGDFVSHYARFILDPLYAKSLVLKNGEKRFTIIMLDLCIVPSDLMEEIKCLVTDSIGITKEDILIACTHTHGAPDVAGILGGAVDISYRKKLPSLVLKSVKKANENCRPAKIASGKTIVSGHHMCRRYIMDEKYVAHNPVRKNPDTIKTNPFGAQKQILRPNAVVDNEIGFIMIKGLDGKWISTVANFASHYAGDWDIDTITADFYGVFADEMCSNLSATDDFIGMLSYGTGANVNTWDFSKSDQILKTDFKRANLIGKTIANSIFESVEGLVWEENPSLDIKYKELKIPIQKPSGGEVSDAEKILKKNRINGIKLDAHGMSVLYAREQLLLNEYPDFHLASVQMMKIGSQWIGASGAELFTETGLWLKRNLKKDNFFTICLANTYDGYVVPSNEMKKGGYETWRARSSFLKDGSENDIKMAMLQLSKDL
jgi:hypothetical protein